MNSIYRQWSYFSNLKLAPPEATREYTTKINFNGNKFQLKATTVPSERAFMVAKRIAKDRPSIKRSNLENPHFLKYNLRAISQNPSALRNPPPGWVTPNLTEASAYLPSNGEFESEDSEESVDSGESYESEESHDSVSV